MEKRKALISVDKEAWEGIQRLCKELHISRNIFNEILNQFLRGQYKMLQGLKDKRDSGVKVSMGDFLRMMGGILNELEDEQLKL